jgi:hypothetical protein
MYSGSRFDEMIVKTDVSDAPGQPFLAVISPPIKSLHPGTTICVGCNVFLFTRAQRNHRSSIPTPGQRTGYIIRTLKVLRNSFSENISGKFERFRALDQIGFPVEAFRVR